jgi:hypothetical protein
MWSKSLTCMARISVWRHPSRIDDALMDATGDAINLLVDRFDAGEFNQPCPALSDFKHRWLQIPASSDPFVSAFHGGLLADRLAWVFLAAYQSAQRSCFAGLPASAWISFAVSEDRSGAVPGVSLVDGRLNGGKSWIAAGPAVDFLIVTPGPSVSCGCFLIEAGRTGVNLTSKAPGSFLPEIMEGRALLQDVEVSDADALPTDHAKFFGLAEPFFVLSAAAGYLVRLGERFHRKELSVAGLSMAEKLRQLHAVPYWQDVKALLSVHQEMAPIGKLCAQLAKDHGEPDATDWLQSGRLLGIYGRGLRQQAAASS